MEQKVEEVKKETQQEVKKTPKKLPDAAYGRGVKHLVLEFGAKGGNDLSEEVDRVQWVQLEAIFEAQKQQSIAVEAANYYFRAMQESKWVSLLLSIVGASCYAYFYAEIGDLWGLIPFWSKCATVGVGLTSINNMFFSFSRSRKPKSLKKAIDGDADLNTVKHALSEAASDRFAQMKLNSKINVADELDFELPKKIE